MSRHRTNFDNCLISMLARIGRSEQVACSSSKTKVSGIVAALHWLNQSIGQANISLRKVIKLRANSTKIYWPYFWLINEVLFSSVPVVLDKDLVNEQLWISDWINRLFTSQQGRPRRFSTNTLFIQLPSVLSDWKTNKIFWTIIQLSCDFGCVLWLTGITDCVSEHRILKCS